MTHMAPVIGPGNGLIPRGQLYLVTPSPLDYAAADTYEPIPGTWAGNALHYFTASEAGVLTYNGPDNIPFLFTGSSDLKASKVCSLSYALYRNAQLIGGAETPVDIDVPLRIYNISITAIVTLNNGDTLRVYSKCDDATAVLNPSTLSITFWGHCP